MQHAEDSNQITGSRIGYGELEFHSVGPPITRTFYLRMWLLFVVVGITASFSLDQSFWQDPILLGMVILFAILFPYVMSRMSKGTILLDHEGITHRASGGRTIRYAWGDIERMFLTSVGARSRIVAQLYRLAGIDVNKEFIELKLKKSLRVNPVTEGQSTRGWGVPTLFIRATHLYANDPPALLAAAEIHLQPGSHA